MSITLIATLGGLWALLIWGVCDWLISRSSKKTNEIELLASLQITGLLVASSAFFISRQQLPSFHDILIICLAGVIFAFAFLSFIKAFAVGSTGIVMPAASTSPLFTLIFSSIFLSVPFYGSQIAAMLVIVAGVMLLAIEKRNKSISLKMQHQATIYALSAAIIWGIGNVIQNIVIGRVSWQNMLFFIDVAMTVMAFVFLFLAGPKTFGRKIKSVSCHKNALMIGGAYTIGSFGFYYGSVKAGNVLIPLVIASAGPLVTSALSAVIDKEKLTIIKRLGAVVAVAGIIALNLS